MLVGDRFRPWFSALSLRGGSEGRRIRRSRLILLLALPALFSCGSIFGTDEESRLGVVSYFGFPVHVDVPDTVAAGMPFEVVVQTYGGGCVRMGDVRIEYSSGTVDLWPYDIHSGASVCTDELVPFQHAVALTLDQPGAWAVRFHGREIPPDSAVLVERVVQVQ